MQDSKDKQSELEVTAEQKANDYWKVLSIGEMFSPLTGSTYNLGASSGYKKGFIDGYIHALKTLKRDCPNEMEG